MMRQLICPMTKKIAHDGHWSPLIHKMFAQKIKSIIKNISFN